MKNNTTNATTLSMSTSETRAALLSSARDAFIKLNNLQNDAEAKNKDILSAREGYESALSALNLDARNNAYASALLDANPVAALCKATHYTRFAFRAKKTGVECASLTARLNLLDFFAACEEGKVSLPVEIQPVKNALAKVATAVKTMVNEGVTKETMSTKATKEALVDFIKTTGVEGVHGRSVDARFLAFAVTKAKEMGELADITVESVVPFVMDMFHVQLLGLEYKFETKETKKEEATKAAEKTSK